jgi:uncharacterized coiled-coil protein SlyX
MSTDMEEQVKDANMNDSSHGTVLGSIDAASKAHNDAMETSSAAPTTVKFEKNNGSGADDESAMKLAKGEQSNDINVSTDPATEVEDSSIDIWDGTFGEDPEKLSPDVLITTLQDDNLALQNKVDFLKDEIKGITRSASYLALENKVAALRNKVAVLENQVAILKGDKTRLVETSITTQHTTLSNTNNTITNANRTIAGKQKQLDSVYSAFQRQENQILGQQQYITTQQNQITAQAVHIHSLQTKHKKQLQDIRKCMNKVSRSVVLRSQKHASEISSITRRRANELELLLNDQVGDPEATESGAEEEGDVGEEGGEGRKEIEVIDLLDDDDGGEVTAVEEPGHVHQSTIFELPATIQQPAVVEQNVTAVQSVTSEESPSKRVKLTEQT